MCLAKAYLNKWGDEPMLQDIAYIWLRDGRVELETLFGKNEVVSGRVIEIDFSASKILLEHDPAAGSSSG